MYHNIRATVSLNMRELSHNRLLRVMLCFPCYATPSWRSTGIRSLQLFQLKIVFRLQCDASPTSSTFLGISDLFGTVFLLWSAHWKFLRKQLCSGLIRDSVVNICAGNRSYNGEICPWSKVFSSGFGFPSQMKACTKGLSQMSYPELVPKSSCVSDSLKGSRPSECGALM